MSDHARGHVRVAVIGSGFGGLGAAVRLRREGITDFVVLERAGAVGGTWRDNTYPGCACDVPSHLYSFSFAPDPDWPRAFSGQPRIRAYLERVTDDFGLRPHLRLGHEVLGARWDADALRWEVGTSRGALTADVVVCATGPLSEPRVPDVPGLDGFRAAGGRVFHSARWDHDYDLAGKRVAVVGTGASAVQIVPAVQPVVGRLTLFQRTPPWVLPRADRAVTRAERLLHRRFPLTAKARRAVLWAVRELQVGAFTKRPGALGAVEALARAHLRRAVEDPVLRAKLTPSYRIGCKRILLSNDYYPALARPNVDVVAAGLAEVRGRTAVGADGSEAEVDALVFGTGFHVTDMPIADRVVGAGGVTLAEAWKDGMEALRGTTAAGFPNWLTVIGPNTGLGNSSMILMIESQLNYLADFLRRLDLLGEGRALVPRPSAVAAWNRRVQARMERTVWTSGGCDSWYLDARGRNTTLWPGTTAEFRRATRAVDPDEYEVVRAPAKATAPGGKATAPGGKAAVPGGSGRGGTGDGRGEAAA
ncbi:flavin-containing monooxygenase [Streptomyces sudanensis]|uniref:flavin-containing monooxygenase n=1 Tax=Streptomyces sudanensis TaxID=436397 RepID=UPI0020CCB61D|nr:NAD(P)/FAD-dependent oxidoreductase [Streptomyces sudanensis]MCP9958613.1 NAD(P)/FAD-dependent oxidoreductase [Streptomyces sudanensis]MCQ0000886.1 NAD(P)/FAD-dependent oxidoreductase [Streptomyces sudanensis]